MAKDINIIQLFVHISFNYGLNNGLICIWYIKMELHNNGDIFRKFHNNAIIYKLAEFEMK